MTYSIFVFLVMLIGCFIQKGFGNDALFIFAVISYSVAVAIALPMALKNDNVFYEK